MAGELSEAGGFNAIITISDMFTKRTRFIPSHTSLTLEGMAQIYRDQIFAQHGLPCAIVHDRGPQYYSIFMKELFNSSASHQTIPRHIILRQMDNPKGSTKNLNSTYDSSSITIRTTGMNGSLLRNSHTMTKSTPPHTCPLCGSDGQDMRRSGVGVNQIPRRYETLLRQTLNPGNPAQTRRQGVARCSKYPRQKTLKEAWWHQSWTIWCH